ncbi:MAG: recombinase family protein [Bacteriovorax sp.]|nr:recombinase family protein [Bacteriovorax sp.]
MIKDVRDGLIEKVIVYSFSRYTRSVTHLLRALEEFKKMEDGKLHSIIDQLFHEA